MPTRDRRACSRPRRSTARRVDRARSRSEQNGQRRSRGLPGSIVQPSTTDDSRIRDCRVDSTDAGSSAASTFTANADATREHVVVADPAPPFGSVYHDSINAIVSWPHPRCRRVRRRDRSRSAARRRTLGVTFVEPCPRRADPTTPDGSVVDDTSLELHAARCRSCRGLERPRRLGFFHRRRCRIAARCVGPRRAVTGSSRRRSALATRRRRSQINSSTKVCSSARTRACGPSAFVASSRCAPSFRDVSIGGLDGGAEAAAYRANIDGMILWQPNFQFIWSPSNFDVRRSGLGVERARRGSVDWCRPPRLDDSLRRQLRRTRAQRPGRIPTPLDGECRGRPFAVETHDSKSRRATSARAALFQPPV
jgi:hypothetical protein